MELIGQTPEITIAPLSSNSLAIAENFSTYEISHTISPAEAKVIEQRILDENTRYGKHMLEKTAEELLYEANTFGCCCLKVAGKLVGFITMMPIGKDGICIFERGSLFVDEAYRKKGLGKILVKEMIDAYSHLPLYAITNVAAVKKINTGLEQQQYIKSELSQRILETIESVGELLEDDVIFGNPVFKRLVQQSL